MLIKLIGGCSHGKTMNVPDEEYTVHAMRAPPIFSKHKWTDPITYVYHKTDVVHNGMTCFVDSELKKSKLLDKWIVNRTVESGLT